MITNYLSNLPLLQAAGGNAGGQMVTMLITFGLIILIFYFLVIRPQNKKQKETKAMLSAIKKGDRVSTAGGMRGTVTAVKDQTVTLKVDTDTKIEFNKSAIANVLERKASTSEKE